MTSNDTRTKTYGPCMINESDVTEFIARLGFDPAFVTQVEFNADRVFVTEQILGVGGKKYVVGAINDPHAYDDLYAVPNLGQVATHVVEVLIRKGSK